LFDVAQTPTLAMAIKKTKEKSNVIAMGQFMIAALAMDKAWGHVGFAANAQRRETGEVRGNGGSFELP
jgi:hypothetical protein